MNTTEEFNDGVLNWSADVRRKLKHNINQMTTAYSGRSRNELKVNIGKEHGEITHTGFLFPPYMVFVHKGAGRGYFSGKKISSLPDKTGVHRYMTGRLMGTGRRMPKEWFNPELEKNLPALSKIIFQYKGKDAVARIQASLYHQAKID